ncbi:MAG TPA: hypothetical protein VFM69_04895 [Pricia sp.]|nr:hypothetical protein [Pricia sp.]
MKPITLDGKECYVITKDVFDDLLENAMISRRAKSKTGLCDRNTAMDILGCSLTTFYARLKEKGCLIKKGSVHGTYLISSVEKERDRNR